MNEQSNGGPITRPEYRREPYVRATIDDGSTVDGKAIAWTSTRVDVKWLDGTTFHSRWFPAGRVQGISRDQSRWTNPYDLDRCE